MSGSGVFTASQNLYGKILSKFPLENLTYCFAYGSGVLKQTNNENTKNMIDFILAVDDAEKWHENNLKRNPSHYSFLSLLGSKALAKVQTNIPSKVYFNSMIPLKDENVVIKYGVITENDLIADLLDWNDLYVAGRLHKPVKIVRKAESEDLVAALQLNLQSAVHASLLLLPETFSEVDFYKTLSSLSYMGDFRMKFGEDKNKVDNIVRGGLQKFRTLYSPILKMMEDYVEMPAANDLLTVEERSCRQDISPSAKHFHLNHLPRTPQRKLVQFWNKGSRNRQDTEDVLRAMAFDQDCGEVFHSILSNIVWDSSIKQSLKGILTAGIFTSVVYSSKKIGKMLKAKSLTVRKKMLTNEESVREPREKFPVERGHRNEEIAETESNFFGPALPPHFLEKDFGKSRDKEKVYGPILPDDVSEKEDKSLKRLSTSEEILIGPALPEHLRSDSSPSEKAGTSPSHSTNESFGPSTDLMATEDITTYYKFVNAQTSPRKVPENLPGKRETWMIELPEKKGAHFGLLPRHFKSQVQTDKESDNSVWTETPADKDKKQKSKKDHKEILKMKRLLERDKQMEKLAKKAAKKLRKKESLLELHLKNMKKKKEKKKKKEEKEGLSVPERRPFDRNIDLQVRRFDKNVAKSIINKSQFLNDRFAPGQSKFL